MNKKELKAFFNKLVDARPELAAHVRLDLVAKEHFRRFTKEEQQHLKQKSMNDRLYLMINPLDQNGNGATDTSDES